MNITEFNTIILSVTALFSAVTPITLAWMNHRQKVRADVAAANVADVKDTLKQKGDVIGNQLTDIHTLVNGKSTALEDQIKAMRLEIVKLTERNAVLATQHTEDAKMDLHAPRRPV